jgi:3-methylcrotonyl-CoA carboxylase beta subunit
MKISDAPPATKPANKRLRELTAELQELEARLRLGGGPEKIERQHSQGKLTARERIDLLLDKGAYAQEIGLLVAYDQYKGKGGTGETGNRVKGKGEGKSAEEIGGSAVDGQQSTVAIDGQRPSVGATVEVGGAPGAGVVTVVGRVKGREVVVVANDATVKAGSWWPETIKKILRAQEIAMRSHVPIIYLVDSAGVNLPYQGGVFPGQYGASRIFYYNSIMRRYLKIPQISAVMGPCVAGGAYLPALSDVIVMVDGTSFMGLGGANLVKGATGQTIDNETLGGARAHNELSGVAHYRVKNDAECIERIREFVSELPFKNCGTSADSKRSGGIESDSEQSIANQSIEAGRAATDLYDIIPEDHKQPYNMRHLLDCLLDGGHLDEFQADYAKEMITGHARIRGIQVGVIANNRGMIRPPGGGPPRFGGIIYTESAEKVAYFIETCNRHQTPLVFIQDVSGFMIGSEAEHSGIIRAGARFVEAMATAVVPKIVLTVNHASGAGYYAMAGQGFDPDFIYSWPTGRMGVMEGDSAVQAVFGSQLEKLKRNDLKPDERLTAEMDQVRETYDMELDAKYAAARGFVDAVIIPENTRDALELSLRTALNYNGPHIGQFVLPPTWV